MVTEINTKNSKKYHDVRQNQLGYPLSAYNSTVFYNNPKTTKAGAISKAQNCRRGTLRLYETPAGCKI